MYSRRETLRLSRLLAVLGLLFKHLADLVDVVAHAAKDPNYSEVKD